MPIPVRDDVASANPGPSLKMPKARMDVPVQSSNRPADIALNTTPRIDRIAIPDVRIQLERTQIASAIKNLKSSDEVAPRKNRNTKTSFRQSDTASPVTSLNSIRNAIEKTIVAESSPADEFLDQLHAAVQTQGVPAAGAGNPFEQNSIVDEAISDPDLVSGKNGIDHLDSDSGIVFSQPDASAATGESAEPESDHGAGDNKSDAGKIESTFTDMPRPQSCYFSEAKLAAGQINGVTNRIVADYPGNRCTILTMASSESNSQLTPVIVSVAQHLQYKTGRRVLVIDSDMQDGFLSREMRCVAGGFSDIVRMRQPTSSLVVATSIDKVDFVARGSTDLVADSQFKTAVNRAAEIFSPHYDYILVNCGDAHDRPCRIWSSICDGSFLVVSMKKSNQNIAKSAVTQLNEFGSRLIGCILSDA